MKKCNESIVHLTLVELVDWKGKGRRVRSEMR